MERLGIKFRGDHGHFTSIDDKGIFGQYSRYTFTLLVLVLRISSIILKLISVHPPDIL